MARLSRFPASRLAFVLPATFAVLVPILGRCWSSNAFDTDEGINLGKGALVAAGLHPYADIWNDQPPLLTYVLAGIQTLMPWSVAAARVTVLAFACLLLYSVFRVIERSAGTAAAAAAVILLGTAPLMWRLSISVMIGLPAIALAMTACAIVYRRDQPGLWRAAIAGIVFALSLQTKLFTGAALPAFLAVAYLSGDLVNRRSRAATAAVALAATVAGVVAVAFVAGEPVLPQLVGPHVSAGARSGYSLPDTAVRIAVQLIQQPIVLFASILAVIPRWRGTSGLRSAWLIWLGCALLALLGHSPIWYHHALLLVVPMACLGGEPMSLFLRAVRPGRLALARNRLLVATALFLALLAYLALLLRPFYMPAPDTSDGTAALRRYSDRDPWVATDQAFGAFRARLLVTPELVVFSRKRIDADNLTADLLIDVIAARHPGQVLLRKAHAPPALIDYLDRTYVRVSDKRIHYVRTDIAR
jgi:hypothetical protein